MRYKKLNQNWNAHPNDPNLMLEKGDNYIEFSFELNPFLSDYIDEGDKGNLEFSNVLKYHIGITNDEGYLLGQHRYSNKELPWGEFYELFESDWLSHFPDNSIHLKSNSKQEELRHFIFFLRDETIECIAGDYLFSIRFKNEEQYKSKYPNEYFDHYLSMFSINQTELEESNFVNQLNLYLQFEGEAEFEDLRAEVNQIIKNGDLHWFLKQAKADKIENINMEILREIMNSIIKY